MPKNIDEIIRESIKLRAPFQHFATVIISEGDIIKGISQSKPNNLILDNFGILLAGLMRAPVDAEKEVTLTDTGNTGQTVGAYGTYAANTQHFNYFDAAYPTGTRVQVGAGTTPAARADYDIETAFIVAPEDDLFDSGTGSYGAGSISVAGAITAGGAGTINEILFTGRWIWQGGSATLADFALFHDILVSGEAFVLGNTITVAYTINL